MGTVIQNQEALAGHTPEADVSDEDLLTLVIEGLEDSADIEVDDAAEPYIPLITYGIKNGDFGVDPQNPLHRAISGVMIKAGVTLPSPPSCFE